MAAGDSGGPAPRTQLRLVGSFAVARGSSPVSAAELGSRKARVLLKLLAVERAHAVPVERITEVLWGAAAPAGPAQNIATLVSRLRRGLGAGVIHGGRAGYRLGSPPAVQVDLDDARRWADEAGRRLAAAEPALALAAASRARDILAAGVVLEDEPGADWAHPARAEQSQLIQRARQILAEAALATGDPGVAAPAAAAAVADDPYDERARRTLMRAHAAAGEPGRALATYAELRDLLTAELGADPAAETQQLHLAVLRERELPADREPGRGARASPGKASPGPAGLPGRAGELRQLRRAWNEAAGGHPELLLVCGEAGIGKTRLVAELTELATTTGGTVLAARCYAAERSLFLQPFVEAIAGAVRAIPPARLPELAGEDAPALARLVPEAAAVLGPAPPARADNADIERRRAFEAVTAFIRAMGERGPVLLSLDDLQNAGRASVELLHYLARHAGRSRLLVVATVRAEEGSEIIDSLADVGTRLELGPLPADAVADLAAASGQADQAESIMRRTRGHALFVVETLRSLAAGHSGMPESLAAAVLARVHRAGRGVEAMLRAGAVLGASFDPATVAALLGETPQAVLGTCGVAYQARLLVVAGRDYEFTNDLVQEVLYATTPAPARLAYHSQAADLLTRKPEAMAAHAAAAGDWQRAGLGWLVAGEEALARAAAADAVELLTRSHDAAVRSGNPEVQARALLTRGRAREALVEFDASVSDTEAAVSLSRETGDRRLEMTGLLALGGDARVGRGRPVADAVEPLERGLAIAAALSDRAMEANLRARLAVLTTHGLRFAEAVQQSLLAVRAARASGNEEALTAALDGQKTSLAYLGEIGLLAPVLDELEPMVRRLGDLYRLHWVLFESSFAALAAGNWAVAIAGIQAALEVHRRSGYRAHAGWHVAVLGAVARLRGRYDEAVVIGRRAVALSEQAPHVWTSAAAGAALGTTLLETGAVDEAVAVLETARVVASQAGAEAILLRCLAPLAEATGSPEILADAAALLGRISTPDGSAFLTADGCYLAVARAWLARGEPARARAALGPLLTAAARVPWVGPLADASLVDGQAALALGLAVQAATSLRRAADLGSRHGMPRIARDAAAALAGQR
jgi:DNA-binding SARP family transcriptional activator/tetratricopeptide (TPR) repeat protein